MDVCADAHSPVPAVRPGHHAHPGGRRPSTGSQLCERLVPSPRCAVKVVDPEDARVQVDNLGPYVLEQVTSHRRPHLRLDRRRPGRIEETLVGRDAELRELHDAALRAAANRRGWVGLIGGEPGIGKTRLVAECADMLRREGFGCAWVSCPEDDAAPPFWVWDQLLGQAGAGGAWRAGAGETDPELARFLLLDAITAGSRQAAADRPLLLVIDDLHWADQGSMRLLAALRGALATLPAVILGTYRDTELTAPALLADIGPERTLALGGLAPGELAASVRLATGSDIPDALLTGLHARTAGNPYFAAEAVRLLRAEGRLSTSAQLPAGLLPDTVRAVLERRLARLPAPGAELLPAAAPLRD